MFIGANSHFLLGDPTFHYPSPVILKKQIAPCLCIASCGFRLVMCIGEVFVLSQMYLIINLYVPTTHKYLMRINIIDLR